ncbi:hypothetical protein CKAH01_05518 [Colletotrichum kahawae]|uniref:Uncharacterized protein n=1 Tax=Colletotrichum kahawae TaxID=34407 RepID=A0AAE0D4V5_COLKA|nr:hypothetical protein CKAH01_05518 [Colletotrichum kahawae]
MDCDWGTWTDWGQGLGSLRLAVCLSVSCGLVWSGLQLLGKVAKVRPSSSLLLPCLPAFTSWRAGESERKRATEGVLWYEYLDVCWVTGVGVGGYLVRGTVSRHDWDEDAMGCGTGTWRRGIEPYRKQGLSVGQWDGRDRERFMGNTQRGRRQEQKGKVTGVRSQLAPGQRYLPDVPDHSATPPPDWEGHVPARTYLPPVYVPCLPSFPLLPPAAPACLRLPAFLPLDHIRYSNKALLLCLLSVFCAKRKVSPRLAFRCLCRLLLAHYAAAWAVSKLRGHSSRGMRDETWTGLGTAITGCSMHSCLGRESDRTRHNRTSGRIRQAIKARQGRLRRPL